MGLEREIKTLTPLYGAPARTVFEFTNLSDNFGAWVTRLTRRRGEIILVVPRARARVLLHTKPHYPENVYRLPTGGIRRREAADAAARREAYEEIGFQPATLRLLGVLENIFWVRGKKIKYPSFVFQTETWRGARRPPTRTNRFRDSRTRTRLSCKRWRCIWRVCRAHGANGARFARRHIAGSPRIYKTSFSRRPFSDE